VPTLALFGELDNNIMAKKNSAAWEAALKAGGNRDYTLRILPNANHYQWEAKVGSNAEMVFLATIRAGLLHDHPGLACKNESEASEPHGNMRSLRQADPLRQRLGVVRARKARLEAA